MGLEFQPADELGVVFSEPPFDLDAGFHSPLIFAEGVREPELFALSNGRDRHF